MKRGGGGKEWREGEGRSGERRMEEVKRGG